MRDTWYQRRALYSSPAGGRLFATKPQQVPDAQVSALVASYVPVSHTAAKEEVVEAAVLPYECSLFGLRAGRVEGHLHRRSGDALEIAGKIDLMAG